MKIAIVKYNAGNIYSVIHALKRLGVDPVLTDDEQELRSAARCCSPDRAKPARRWVTCVSMG